jgi:hypothetical protein
MRLQPIYLAWPESHMEKSVFPGTGDLQFDEPMVPIRGVGYIRDALCRATSFDANGIRHE